MDKRSEKEHQVNIVVVEDDEGHTFLIKKNLQKAGIINPFIHLADGEEAIHFFSGKGDNILAPEDLAHSIVLLDLNLPKYTGVEVLESIRKNEDTKHIPVLILSSTTREEEIKNCYRLGCNIFLNKPVDYTSFSEAIMQFGLLLKIVKVSI